MDDVLRRPGPVPEVPVPFVGRDGDVVRLADELMSAEGANVLVLHGPAGVGKSAVAAAVARRLADRGLPVHWVTVTGAEDVERLLLCLLADHGAPRRQAAQAYGDDPRAFRRELRQQCSRYLRDSVVVLDGVRAAVGRGLLGALDLSRLRVIVTSRQRTVWQEGTHAVRPLGGKPAARLAALIAKAAGPSGGLRPALDLPGLLRPARGLPPLVRVAGTVPVRGVSPSDAKGLLALALIGVSDPVREVLGKLSVREPNTPFGRRTLGRLAPDADLPDLLDELLRHQVLGRAGEDCFELAEPIAEAVRHSMPVERRPDLAREVNAALWAGLHADAAEAYVLLDGRLLPDRPVRRPSGLSLGDLTRGVDSFTEPPEPLPDMAETLVRAQAAYAAVRGDTHRLIALHRRFPNATNQVLAAATLHLGLPQTSHDLLSRASDLLATTYETADVAYCSGDLASTLEALDGGTELSRVDVAWQAVLEGAALCDQGWPVDAEAMLQFAAEEHRKAGCLRGRGWALLHLARACLVTGEATRAEHTLNQAGTALRAVADERGLNWVATERLRVHLLLERLDQVREQAQRALTAHEAAGDVRGMGWTCQYLAMAHARLGDTDDARVTLRAASNHFRQCGDALGAAWTRHRNALLIPGPGTVDELHGATGQFRRLGCPHGQAWSLTELALRSRPGRATDDALSLADALFAELKDEGGALWAGIVRDLHREVGLGLPFDPGDLPSRIRGRDALIEDVQHFAESLTSLRLPLDPGTGVWPGPGIPLRARDLVYVSARQEGDVPRRPHCQVRLTLLDESPSTSVRLRLRVVPEHGHPWTAPGNSPSWLTVVAVPLTPASVVPPSALLRPSVQPVHGAEFDVTVHRPGIHVIRFTISLERTGTVLQQVETELEILDTDATGERTAPHAVAQRGGGPR